MPLSDQQRQLIQDWRTWIESVVSELGLFGPSHRHDREDDSTLATRWEAEPELWYEVALRPFLPQIRVGLVTTDRWKSEELEQRIEDSGDTMQEFVEFGFDSVNLAWHEPPVEHYRHEGKFFYFATPLDLKSLDQLAEPQIREQTQKMIQGYHSAFDGQAAE